MRKSWWKIFTLTNYLFCAVIGIYKNIPKIAQISWGLCPPHPRKILSKPKRSLGGQVRLEKTVIKIYFSFKKTKKWVPQHRVRTALWIGVPFGRRIFVGFFGFGYTVGEKIVDGMLNGLSQPSYFNKFSLPFNGFVIRFPWLGMCISSNFIQKWFNDAHWSLLFVPFFGDRQFIVIEWT